MFNKLSCPIPLFLVLALSGFAQAELLPNPGFEDGLASWKAWGGGEGEDAAGYFWAEDYHADIVEDGTAHSGNAYITAGLPDREGWWWAGMWVFQEHPVTEGKTYKITGWVRVADANGVPTLVAEGVKISFEWRDAAPVGATDTGDRGEKLPDGVINHPFDLTEQWTYVSATEVAPAGALGLTVAFLVSPGIDFDLDDASFVEILPTRGPDPADGAIGISSDPVLDIYVSDDVPKDIQDLQPTTPKNTLGRTTSLLAIANSTTITDLNVELDITMPGNNADLNVFLKSPDGKQVELFTDVGFNQDDFKNTVLDDEASTSIKDGAEPFTGTFKPEGKLRDFDGRNTAGDWQLKIEDDWRADGGPDNAVLNSWKLIVESLNIVSWVPGDDIASQDVYISTSFADVNDSAEAAYYGNVAADVSAIEIDLDVDQTYYWRVDSLDADGALTNVGDIWSFATAPEPIYVDPSSDLAAANELAKPGGTIHLAEGTYILNGPIDIKEGVTYQGAGAGLTSIDGNDVTRVLTAWGDLGATDGQVDENGDGVPNLTGPTRWVLDGLTIQNGVADAAGRQDILSAARDLLNNYVADTPYTLEAAQAENAGLEGNPEWFDLLSGGADDDLTDVELQAYLDANPVGSEGHLVANEGMNTGGGALILRNGASGTIQNCSFLNNQAPLNSGDGGAINTFGSGVALIIDNCEFNGNSCIDGGGSIRINSGSGCTITGTIFAENQAITESGDGGAIMTSGSGVALTIDNCEFNGNACIDAGGAVRLGAAGSTSTITGTAFTGNYTVEGSGDGGAIRVTGDDSTYVLTDCTFTGNYAADDGAAVRYGPDRSELTVSNCSFIGNGMDADGNVVGDDGVWSTNDDDCGPMTLENCLFADNACNDDRLVELKAAFSLLNCTFIGNVGGDKPLIGVRGRDWDSTGDGDDDVTTDDSIIANCLFINNTMLSDGNVIGDTRNDVFAPTVINCLFFGNLNENGEPASNTNDDSVEVGTIDVSAVTDVAEIIVDDRPVAGSPAVDASDPDTATASDIEGKAAVGARDIGAYESDVDVTAEAAGEATGEAAGQ
ncbi:MAG: proprotein convertase P-domain-containing protein [Planctomycetota bacterium]|jgi:subtilisin-like proprotein convertase family protein